MAAPSLPQRPNSSRKMARAKYRLITTARPKKEEFLPAALVSQKAECRAWIIGKRQVKKVWNDIEAFAFGKVFQDFPFAQLVKNDGNEGK